MKENSIKNERSSIEEDMRILENLKTAIETGLVNFSGKSMYDWGYQETIENILSDYKRVLKENKELEKENENLQFSHMNLYNEYKHYKQFESLSNEIIKNKIEYLDKQQADWIEDRKLKVSDSEIIFARDILEKLLEDNYEKF